MQELRQSTAIIIKVGTIVNSTGVTPVTNLSIDAADEAEILKNGTSATLAISGTLTAITGCDGYYNLTLASGDTSSLGPMKIAIQDDSVCLPYFQDFMVVTQNYYDTKYNSTGSFKASLTSATYTSADSLKADVSGVLSANIISISGDTSAADNLELQYDGTGLTGDTYPAKQSQIANIAVAGAAINSIAESYVLTTGTQAAGTYVSTQALDGVVHQLQDAAGTLDAYYQFDVGSDGVPITAKITGALTGLNDSLNIYAYNWVGTSWDQVGGLVGKSSSINAVYTYDLYTSHVGTGANAGKVRLRFYNTGLSSANLYIDQVLISYSVVYRSIGYAFGAIWLNTINGTAGTTVFINGTADNPVDTLADALTLSTSLGIDKFYVMPLSSVTFVSSQDSKVFDGDRWLLALNSQSISGSVIKRAIMSGTATGATIPFFEECLFDSTTTLPPFSSLNCGLRGTIVAQSAGIFNFINCHSVVAGTDTPIFDCGSGLNASDLNFRNYSGGIEIRNFGVGTGDYKMSIEGNGQIVIASSCVGGEIAIRGNFTITDNASGAVTLVDDARFDMGQFNDIAVSDIISGVADGSYDLQEMQRLMFAALCGKVSGGSTTSISIRDSADSKNRIVATVDANGNRTAMTLDGS
jgi:hypothetical protein